MLPLNVPIDSRRRGRRAAALIAALAVTLAACGASGEGTADAPTTTAAESTTTTPTSTSDDTTSTQPDDGGDGDDPVAADVGFKAGEYRDRVGDLIAVDCEPIEEPGTIWGAGIYTDDSSVCTAAAHVGLLDLADGGEVTIVISEGLDEYEAATANDLTSLAYAGWGGSFQFPDAPPEDLDFEPADLNWTTSAVQLELEEGDSAAVTCASNGSPVRVWGTGTYTSDSSICSAAAYEGLIDVADGGTVMLEVIEGQDAYEGGEANGITSQDYGSWDTSFRFVDDLAEG